MQASPKIAIIGGGPAGLTLARLLHTKGMAATVFEADTSPDSRGQGGSLDLHTESGLLALEAAGLTEAFNRVARPEDQGVRLYDKDGLCVYEDQDEQDSGRPEIDRAELRALLLRSLPEGVVRWKSKVATIQPLPDGRYEVRLDSGSASLFDLVVGAEGTWSRTRNQVSAVKPAYSGFTAAELVVNDADIHHPGLSRLVGHGKMFALADEKALIAQRNGHGRLHVYLFLRVPEGGISTAREDLLAHLAGWSPDLRALVEAADDHVALRAIHVLPTGLSWPHRDGLTLIGDAAHVISPFAGEGVNNAMLDSVKLAEALTEANDWRAAVRDFEEDMFTRIIPSATASADAMDRFMASDGLAQAIAIFRGHMREVV